MDAYHLAKEIGKGAFGTAYIVQHKATGERFVLKKIRLARQAVKERQGSLRELQLLSSIAHRNIIRFHEAWVESGCIVCIVIELCESGDLSTQLALRKGKAGFFAEAHLQEMLVQLVSGLAHLHGSWVAHRDIKCSNVLISASGCLKLADFGLAAVLDPGRLLSKTMVGTPGYMAPQVMARETYDVLKADVWSLGCVMFEASALKPAFAAFNMTGLVKKVTSGSPPALPAHYSEDWKAVIRAMLEKDERARPSASDILALPWLQDARARVEARFGPQQAQGASPTFTLQALPGPIAALAEQFRQQAQEEEERARVAMERKLLVQAKFAAAQQGPSRSSAPRVGSRPVTAHPVARPCGTTPSSAISDRVSGSLLDDMGAKVRPSSGRPASFASRAPRPASGVPGGRPATARPLQPANSLRPGSAPVTPNRPGLSRAASGALGSSTSSSRAGTAAGSMLSSSGQGPRAASITAALQAVQGSISSQRAAPSAATENGQDGLGKLRGGSGKLLGGSYQQRAKVGNRDASKAAASAGRPAAPTGQATIPLRPSSPAPVAADPGQGPSESCT